MKKISPQRKTLNYLKSKGWIFDNETDSAKDLKTALQEGHRTQLADSVRYLLTQKWAIYSLKDIKNLDEARKIYRRLTN